MASSSSSVVPTVPSRLGDAPVIQEFPWQNGVVLWAGNMGADFITYLKDQQQAYLEIDLSILMVGSSLSNLTQYELTCCIGTCPPS